jgi:transposase InsO family protein
MARREVEDLLRRYRRVWRKRRRALASVLRWTRPGTVWAVDFAEPPLPVEGRYGRLLAVRDLASGCQLLWLPVEDDSAATAAAALESLFRECGPPVVLKTDNGSAFFAGELEALLARWEVEQMRSPPRMPRYNGACEAGIGSMKARTHHRAAAEGRPGQWTCDDAEAARQEANQTARPNGPLGPTPEESWLSRVAVALTERMGFVQAVQSRLAAAVPMQQDAPDAGGIASARRTAVVRVLIDNGLLQLRSGSRNVE